MQDLTEFVTAVRTNEPRVVAAFGERFPSARLYLPLATLEGVKNRPETANKLGVRLPVHRLKLGNGGWAAALFTDLRLCREGADKLSWNTDGKAIKTLVVPGSVALPYLQELLVSPELDRAIMNPATDAELHLSRTDVDAMAEGKPLRSLWFYTRDGTLKVPVEIGKGSLLGAVLELADRAFSKKEETVIEEVLTPADPLPALASELRELLSKEGAGPIEIVIEKSRNELRVEAIPNPGEELLARIRAVAVKHLAHDSGTTQVRLRIEGRSTPAPPKPPKLDYIPLEPEE